jgi:F420-non-reducing hydrogenase small subunit
MEQGYLCLGPVTKAGCAGQTTEAGEAKVPRCIKGYMPCRGCFGPPPGVIDQGAKLVSAVASIYDASSKEDIEKMVKEMADPAGTFYRFGMSISMLKRKHLQRK